MLFATLVITPRGRFLPWLCALGIRAGMIIPIAAHAQTNQVVTGIVQDELTGMPLESARVRLLGTDISSSTDGGGRFLLSEVPPGVWRVGVERLGYLAFESEHVTISEGFRPGLTLRLTPNPISLPSHSASSERPPMNSPRGVRRLTREQLQRAGHRTLLEAIDDIPGVQIHGSPETPGGTRVSIGGVSPERVAILIDGLPLCGNGDGSVNLDAVPLAAVSAIEVTPGANSLVAGDAAMGGVVNIITRPTQSRQPRRGRIIAGQHDHYDASLSGDESLLGAGARWAVEKRQRGNTFEYPHGDSAATRHGVGMDDWRFFGAISPARMEWLSLSAFHYQADLGQPGALQQPTPGATNATRNTRVQARWQGRSGAYRPMAAAWFESARDHYISPVSYRSDAELVERFAGLRTGLDARVIGFTSRTETELRGRWTEGIDHLRPQSSFGVHNRTEWTVRHSATGRLDSHGHTLALTVGGAIDGDDSSAPVYSPRVDLAWSTPTVVTLRGGWGRAFRRPPLTSLFWKADAFAVGNPNLKPERSRDWDLGVEVRLGPLRANSRYFDREIEGMILWQRATATGQYTPLNLDRVESYGREDQASLAAFREHLHVSWSHVWNASYDETGVVNYDGQVIPLTPRHTHDLSLEGEVWRISTRLSGQWVSERQIRRDNDPGKTLRPYRLFNLYLRAALSRQSPDLSVAARINNLTNERYDLLERYPGPGRTWALEAAIGF